MATRVTVFRSRYRVAHLARRLRAVVATLAGGPSRIIAPLIVSALGLWLTTKSTGGRTQEISSVLLDIVGYLVAAYAVFMVVRWGDRLRRTTTFEEFTDETGEGLSAFAKSLSVLVPIEYERLRRLHRQAEETDSYEKPIDEERYRSPRATVKAEDVATFLETAFQPDSTLSVGLLRIPIQAVGTLVGRLLRGPRITGNAAARQRRCARRCAVRRRSAQLELARHCELRRRAVGRCRARVGLPDLRRPF